MIYNINTYYLREIKRYYNDACHTFGLENDTTIQLGYLWESANRGLCPISWSLQEAFRLYNEEIDRAMDEIAVEHAYEALCAITLEERKVLPC